MNVLYLESIAGIAGDMFTASFLDAGLVTINELETLSKHLGLHDVELTVSEVIRSAMRSTHIDIQFDERLWQKKFMPSHHRMSTHSASEAHIPFHDLDRLIHHSTLPEKTKILARKILKTLAIAEARCHGVGVDDVVFHELGMADSIMDIVMAAHCIATVNPLSILASPIKLGKGLVTTAHGTQPVPPPVSAALSVDMSIATIPLAIQDDNIELSTPTGLAILKALQPVFCSNWPMGKLLSQGYGAGTMNLTNFPNLFRIALFETQNVLSSTLPYLHDTVVEIASNYDDCSPEQLAWVTEKLFKYGALDVWQTSSVGKKGRVMITLSVLAPVQQWQLCVDFLLKKTSTFGVRYTCLDRLTLKRNLETRVIDENYFQVKIGYDNYGNKIKEKFEFEDVRKIWDEGLKFT